MKKIRIAITTGDTDGIGLEVSQKSLNRLGPQKGIQFIVFRSESSRLRLNTKWKRRCTVSEKDLLNPEFQKFDLLEVASTAAPGIWFEYACKLALKKHFAAIVTGPLSKTGIMKSGLRDLGHTDILKRITKAKSVRMAFVGKYFNVLLNSGHIPLRQASDFYNELHLRDSLQHTNNLRLMMKDPRPIGLLGLNPHAGEDGLIGNNEIEIKKVFSFAQRNRIPLQGPLVPDAAFFKSNWKKYSCFLAAYHDQGLIPFKLVHGQNSGVHVTLGIPFIRTSVDHGTAKDIFGLNKANPCSMLEAISLAISLAKK